MDKKYFLFMLILIYLTAINISAQDNSPLLRYPSLNSNGTQVAFSYQGDIWTASVDGGTANRLTIHEAYESLPKWSNDDKFIAFTSDRYGDDDIYYMTSDGSSIKRLTHHSSPDVLSDWTPNNEILFNSRREFVHVERDPEIQIISATGGTEYRYMDALGYYPTVSPDGRFIAFVQGNCGIDREDYNGPANKDIWLYDTKNKTYKQVTSLPQNEFAPDWGSARTLYYLSAQSGRYNIVKINIDDTGTPANKPEQVTSFKDDGIRYFDVSANGKVIVFERQAYIAVLKEGSTTPAQIKIKVTSDYKLDPYESKTFTKDISEYSISPNGKYAALVIRGEIFISSTDKEKKNTVNVTNHSYRDQEPAWVNDSVLVFTSDREGQKDLYMAFSSDKKQTDIFKTLKHGTIRLTNTNENEHSPVVSPDGKKIAFVRGNGKLIAADIDNNKIKNETVLQDSWASPNGITWSPDSKWLAFSSDDLEFNEEVYIQPADKSMEAINISMHPKADRSPVWSTDGSKLGFISDRNSSDSDVWFVWLKKEDWERTAKDWEELKDETPKKENDKDKKEKKQADIKIDTENMYERLTQVTALPGNESDLAISNDGETFYFVTNRSSRQTYKADMDLHSIKWDGTDMKPITKNNTSPFAISIDKKGANLFYVKRGGTLSKIDVKQNKEESLSFSAKMIINYAEERDQIFEEAWRTLNDGFYDPKFHGYDWEVLKKKYKPWAMKASEQRDFADMFNFLLGQLNASHMRFSAPSRTETQKETTALLGAELMPVDHAMKVVRVIPNTPADKITSKLNVGDVITIVDGVPVTNSTNFYSLLLNKADQQVLLTVEDIKNISREVVIRPLSRIRDELYQEWVNDRKKLTEKYSNGRLGYIHIQGMDWPSFERFERELTAAGLGKEGIVIDVRFNGGGWITDYLMAVLNVKQHAYTIPRGAAKDLNKEHLKFTEYYPYGERLPLSAWTKPSIAMCNTISYSNAEIFSHAYKTLGIGKLVGTPTFGAVISTGGRGLLDGSFVRLPFRGWFVKATKQNMENIPATPDIIIDNAPDSKAKGNDEQLKKAVDELLKDIDSKK